jgi:poly-gamma-glutamate synthesis protein (capsule biosynthesis protein)
MKKVLLILGTLILIVGLSYLEGGDPLDFIIPEERIPEYVTITVAGDVMMDRGVENSVNKNFAGDFSQILKNVDIFLHDDISFLNLEGPVSDMGRNVGSKYSFRMNPVVIDVLKNAGVDMVSFANNHVGDYTVDAFTDTMHRLDTAGILYAGAGENHVQVIEPTAIEKNGIKTCFLASSDVGPEWMKATDTTAGILLANDPNFIQVIKDAKTKCDILAVSIHWGDEYKPHNKRQETLAHSAIDAGADIIIGAHPHVAQDIEIYKDKPIIYSLGNFIFDQYFSPETMSGLVVQMKVYKTGEIKDIVKYKNQLNKYFQIESILPM